VGVRVEVATAAEAAGILGLAGEVEHWFGPMVDDPGFQRAVDEHIAQQRAFVAFGPGREPAGAVLLGGSSPRFAVHWLVVSDRVRGQGVGRALISAVIERSTNGAGLGVGEVLEVVTFGPDHPGAVDSGARVFYERLGFEPAEPAPDGPEGGSRQVYRLAGGV
jgi:GNAT superfamily N-acetyltransferase